MTRPNFLIIVADQLRADAVGAFGSPIASTPHIDALAERGARFTNAFVQHTVCSPSRASFLTGWYPHVRGHRSLTHLLGPDDPNVLRTLKEAGYHVTHVGDRIVRSGLEDPDPDAQVTGPGALGLPLHRYALA